jgi:hypothetical protein
MISNDIETGPEEDFYKYFEDPVAYRVLRRSFIDTNRDRP